MYFKVDESIHELKRVLLSYYFHNAILPLIFLSSSRTGKNAKGMSLLLLCVNVKYITNDIGT